MVCRLFKVLNNTDIRNNHSLKITRTVRNMQQQITYVDAMKQGKMNPIWHMQIARFMRPAGQVWGPLKLWKFYNILWWGLVEEGQDLQDGQEKRRRKKSHTSNTWPFHTCVIQEYRIYTMCWSLYYESLFIPWVQVNTMSLSLYHESFAISDIQFNTMSPSLHQDFKFIPWVL